MSEAGVLSAIPTMLPDGQNIGVLTCICSAKRLLPLELVISMACQSAPTHMSTGYLGIKNLPIEQARQAACEKALELGAKYLWFIDDDTVPPPNCLKRLIYILDNYPDVGVVGGVYVTRDPVQPQPVVFRGMGKGSYWGWKAGDIFEVTGMGAGCMVIKMDIFKDMPKPWFQFESQENENPAVAVNQVSEDIYFCNKVMAAGYKIFAHGGVLCDHYDTATGKVYRMPADSYPMRPREAEQVLAPETEQESQKEKQG